MSKKWRYDHLFHAFRNMEARCDGTDPKSRYYKGRGIIVCKEWHRNWPAFRDWALTHGYEKGLSLDRIISAEDYFPENCRWIPLSENRSRRRIYHNPVGVFDEAVRRSARHRPWPSVPVYVWRYYAVPGYREWAKQHQKDLRKERLTSS